MLRETGGTDVTTSVDQRSRRTDSEGGAVQIWVSGRLWGSPEPSVDDDSSVVVLRMIGRPDGYRGRELAIEVHMAGPEASRATTGLSDLCPLRVHGRA